MGISFNFHPFFCRQAEDLLGSGYFGDTSFPNNPGGSAAKMELKNLKEVGRWELQPPEIWRIPKMPLFWRDLPFSKLPSLGIYVKCPKAYSISGTCKIVMPGGCFSKRRFEGPWYISQLSTFSTGTPKWGWCYVGIASIALPHAMSMETFLNLWDDMGREFHIRFGTSPKPQYAFVSGWNHIGKCCEWVCFANGSKQACIRQNHSKILGQCSVHEPHGYKHPLFCQMFVFSIVAPLAHPIQRTSEWRPHHPQG